MRDRGVHRPGTPRRDRADAQYSRTAARRTHLRLRHTRVRRRLVKGTLLRVVDQVIARHPVDTGRSRDAWIDAANQLWDGSVDADSEGHAMQREEKVQTTMEVTNEVDYVVFLEEGTRKLQGRQMVSRSLVEGPGYLLQIIGQCIYTNFRRRPEQRSPI